MSDLSLVDAFGYLFQGLGAVFTPTTFAALVVGLVMGFWVGILPGVGGPTTLALLIPFTFTMDPFAAFALLLGMIAVTSTAGDMTAILFGIPGESANAATLVDGLPMAKNGEAGRALGAVLMASLLGSVIGAICLAIGIVAVRPLVLSVGYAEFFMLSLAGITFLAALSAGAVFKGLAAGALGLLLSVVGMSQVTGIERFTFGSLFLWDGLNFVPAILGLYALPELIDMASGRSRLTQVDSRLTSAFEGVKDAFRHFWLIVRCSAIAAYIGLIPGMGASISQWVAYGHAAQTAKDRSKIGHGAVEGVLGPGAANNATMSGSLIPTIGFGVPGSPQMAILLGAFIVQGLVPGPSMLMPEANGGHLALTFSMVWMIIVANLIVVAVAFLFLDRIARVAYLDEHLLIPFILVLVFIGAFANQNDLNDVWVCFGFGLLGWAMSRLGWPRPPLILGLVLGALIENNLFLTIEAYGASWVTRPGVLLIAAIMVASIAWPFLKSLRRRSPARPAAAAGAPSGEARAGGLTARATLIGDTVLAGLMLLLFGVASAVAAKWPASASLMPLVAGTAGIVLALAQLAMSIAAARRMGRGRAAAPAGDGGAADLRAGGLVWSIYFAYFALVFLVGFVYATAVFLVAYLVRRAGMGRVKSLVLGVASAAGVYFGFQRALALPFERGWLIALLKPALDLTLP